jgi:predicted Zn-dependent peptidase
MSKIEKLDGNITLVTELIPTSMSVAFGIWVKTGSVNETDDINGISHFIEHMMFKGTAKRDAKQIAESFDRIGGQFNAFTGKEATCYYAKTLTSNMEKGMEILFDMFTSSLFDEKEMEREKRVIYEEMKMIKDAPDEDAMDTIGELVFTGNPLGRSIIGSEESLSGIGRDTLVDYYTSQYTKDSVVVSVAGNFDEESVKRIVSDKLQGLKESKKEAEAGEETYETLFRIKTKDIEQSHICLATRTVPWNDERYAEMQILNSIVGGAMSSRLFQNVRERKGLAYSVYSTNVGYKYRGSYTIYAGVSHENIGEALRAIKHELDVLAAEGVSEEEMEKAKEQIKSAYIFGQESVLPRMLAIGKKAVIYGEEEKPEETLERIDKATKKSVDEVSALITDIENYSAVAVTNKEIDLEKMIRESI